MSAIELLRVRVGLRLKTDQHRRTAMLAFAAALGSRIGDFAQQLADGDIDEEEFTSEVTALLSRQLTQAADHANAPDPEAIATAIIDGNSDYLDSFTSDISGLSAEALTARAALWGGLAWSAYQRGHREAAQAEGRTRAYWATESGAQTCDDCQALEDGSPYDTVDELPIPGDGSTQCLSRCRCSVSYDEG